MVLKLAGACCVVHASAVRDTLLLITVRCRCFMSAAPSRRKAARLGRLFFFSRPCPHISTPSPPMALALSGFQSVPTLAVVEATRVARATHVKQPVFVHVSLPCSGSSLLDPEILHSIAPPCLTAPGSQECGSPLPLYPGELVIFPGDMGDICKSHCDCQLACQLKLQSPSRSGVCMAV
jgi:hypothetical protein